MNVLVSSAGRRGALVRIFQEAVRSVGGGSVVAVDSSPLTAAGWLADEVCVVPRCDDPAFLPYMLELCERRYIDLLVPTIDPELGVYAASRYQFQEVGTTVASSSPETIAIAADKRATYRWLIESGFPTVRTVELTPDLSDPPDGYPAVVKPAQGSAGEGVTIVGDRDALASRRSERDLVVQPVAAGLEYTADALVRRDGRCLSVVLRRRLEIRGGEVSKALTVKAPLLQDLVRRVVEALPGAFGPLTVQLFAKGTASEDELAVIEINPRFGGGFPLSWAAGALFPIWMMDEIEGRAPTGDPDGWRDQLLMLRYDDAVFLDATQVGM